MMTPAEQAGDRQMRVIRSGDCDPFSLSEDAQRDLITMTMRERGWDNVEEYEE